MRWQTQESLAEVITAAKYSTRPMNPPVTIENLRALIADGEQALTKMRKE